MQILSGLMISFFSKGTFLYVRKLLSNGASHNRMVFKKQVSSCLLLLFLSSLVNPTQDSGIYFLPFSKRNFSLSSFL